MNAGSVQFSKFEIMPTLASVKYELPEEPIKRQQIITEKATEKRRRKGQTTITEG